MNDTQSFDEAFASARQELGIGGVFTWHNRVYNTFTKEEWADLSLQQRQEFLSEVGIKPVVQQPPIPDPTIEPLTFEGRINGQRVIGLDFDHDGVIDTLVYQGEDGNMYHLVDASGNEKLDTLYQFDALTQQTVLTQRLENPFILTNDNLQQGLEESMAAEVVGSTLQSAPTPDSTQTDDQVDDKAEETTDPDSNTEGYLNQYDEEGYVKNAEMEEYND